MNRTAGHRVVIVGGGFGGLFAARALRRSDVAITLVDRAQHHLFQPLLYQVATGILSEGQIAAPLRDVLKRHRNVECLLAEVVDVDATARQVVAAAPGGERVTLPYDDLIVAAGLRQSYFGHDEFARWAPGMKTIADALAIRRRVFGAFELAETASDPEEQRRRGSRSPWSVPARPGSELAGQIRELATRTLRAEFRRIRPEDARVLLFDGGNAPLASFGPALSAKAAAALRDLGVELQHGLRRSPGWTADGPRASATRPGTTVRHEAGTVLWAAGSRGAPVAEALAEATGAGQDRAGRIQVRAGPHDPRSPGDLRRRGPDEPGDKLPGVAEVAMQSGLYAGRRIRTGSSGRPPGPAPRSATTTSGRPPTSPAATRSCRQAP